MKTKNIFQKEEILKQLENTFKEYEASNLDKSSSDTKERYKALKSFYEYIKQKSHSRQLLSQIYFIAQFVSQILEFLLIKENGRKPHWCSDRDDMAIKCNGILFF